MTKVKILIDGPKVQEIGYRIFLLEKALENGISNIYAKNLSNDKVELLIDDHENKIEQLYKIILNERPEGAIVDAIKKEPYNGDTLIPPIDRYFQFLTLEQMSRGREEIIKIPSFVSTSLEKVATALSGIDNKFGEVINRFGLFGEQAKEMNSKLEKQGDRLNSMDDKLGNVEQKLGSMDGKLGGIDEKLSTLPDRIAKAIYSKENKP